MKGMKPHRRRIRLKDAGAWKRLQRDDVVTGYESVQ
jgi:hypothetical protein